MTTGGKILIVVEELLFGYAVYVVLFDIFNGWWNLLTADAYKDNLKTLIFAGVFIIVFVMCQVCFIVTAATDPGYIKSDDHSMPEIKQPPSGYQVPRRSCKTCLIPKPDRAHHCRRCNKCVLKMDHHCFFVNNCIGFHNYKYFFNFLCWMMVFTLLVIAVVIRDGIFNLHDDEYIRFTALVAGILSFAAFIFVFRLFYYHCKFVVYGLTTIEHEEKKLKGGHLYDLGCARNCAQIFGKNPCGWCIPYWSSSGNGKEFDIREKPTEYTTLIL